MPQRMTDEQLAAIERRSEIATGGLWVVVHDGTERSIATTDSGRFVCHLNSNMLRYTDDADFIAHARNDVPDLVAEVRRLRADLKALTDALDTSVQCRAAATLRSSAAVSNDLRELAYEIAQHGCPTTADLSGEARCFYCSGDYLKREGATVTRTETLNHESDCPWPPFEAEANA